MQISSGNGFINLKQNKTKTKTEGTGFNHHNPPSVSSCGTCFCPFLLLTFLVGCTHGMDFLIAPRHQDLDQSVLVGPRSLGHVERRRLTKQATVHESMSSLGQLGQSLVYNETIVLNMLLYCTVKM